MTIAARDAVMGWDEHEDDEARARALLQDADFGWEGHVLGSNAEDAEK